MTQTTPHSGRRLLWHVERHGHGAAAWLTRVPGGVELCIEVDGAAQCERLFAHPWASSIYSRAACQREHFESHGRLAPEP